MTEATPIAKQARTWQIGAAVLAVLLVASLFFGFSKSSAASSAKEESAAKSVQIAAGQKATAAAQAEADSTQAELDTANAQLAACSAAVSTGIDLAWIAWNTKAWFAISTDDVGALRDQFLTDSAVCDPSAGIE